MGKGSVDSHSLSSSTVKEDVRMTVSVKMLTNLGLVCVIITVITSHKVAASSSTDGDPATVNYNSGWANRNHISSGQDDMMKKLLSKGCAHRYTLNCLKLDIVSFVDKLEENEAYQVFPGVSVVKENNNGSENSRKFQAELVASLAKDYPNDVDARVDAFLVKRVGQYLDTHAINVKLFDNDSVATARQLGEQTLEYYGLSGAETGRGKDKKGGGMMMALAMMGMMKGMMGAFALALIAGVSAKALMTALMALMMAGLAALKGLGGGGGKNVTYEIVSKPVYSHEHSHSHEVQHGHGGSYGHSSYGRSFAAEPGVEFQDSSVTSHDLAYSAYARTTQPPSTR